MLEGRVEPEVGPQPMSRWKRRG